MIIYARKGKNEITLLYLKAKRYATEDSKSQEEKNNMPQKKEIKDGYDKKEDWQKKLDLPCDMEITMVCQ